jgi:DNA-binding IclR family transcriptional regulator
VSSGKGDWEGGRQKSKAPQPNVGSLVKAFGVLEAFKDRERFLSLGELASATSLDKSAVQRFTRTLRELGYLEQDPVTRRYALGRRLLELSYWFLRSQPVTDRALPLLVDLRQAVGERVDLVLLDGDHAIYTIRMQAKREIFRPALVGRRVPLFCTAAGRAMLACLPEAKARHIVEASDRRRFTPHTRTEVAEIMTEVEKARQQGYAIQSEEWLPAEMVAAAAVTDQQRRPIGAVNIAVSTTEWTQVEFERRMVSPLTATAREISD